MATGKTRPRPSCREGVGALTPAGDAVFPLCSLAVVWLSMIYAGFTGRGHASLLSGAGCQPPRHLTRRHLYINLS